MQSSEDAAFRLQLRSLNLLGKFRDHGLALGSAPALLYAQNRPVPPRKNGGDRCRKILSVFRPSNDIRAAFRVAELRRRREDMNLRGPQFFHRGSFQPSTFSFQQSAFLVYLNCMGNIQINFPHQQAEG
jgi:hypothetical protein